MNLWTNYRKLLLAALTLAACGAAAAQGDLHEGVAAAATPDSILLRWLLPEQTYPAGGFVITRTGGAPAAAVTLPAPLPRDQALAAGLVTPEEYDFLLAAFAPAGLAGGAAADGSTGGAEFGRAIATLTTIGRPDFARAMGTLYEDREVEAGVDYTYTVTTAGGALVGSVRVRGGDVRALAPLSGLAAAAQDASVALSWPRPAEETLVASYNLYRASEEGETRLNVDPFILPIADGTAAPLYVDDSAEVGRTYTYTLEGIDLFGRLTPRSAPLTVHLPDTRRLPTPALTDVQVGDLSVTLTWAPPGDERVRMVGVRRRTDIGEPTELLTERLVPYTATSFTDLDVVGGVNYYYTLVSVDASGRISAESSVWAERAHNPTPPSAPAGVSLVEDALGLTLSWEAPPEEDVGSYRIYLSRQPNPRIDDFRYADATVETGYRLAIDPGSLSELHVLVRAVNTSDVEGPPSEVVSGRLLDTTPPPAPRLIEAVAGQGQLTLRWALTADPDVHAFDLYRAAAGGAYELVGEGLAPGQAQWVDGAAQAGVEYSYVLEAIDASGNRSERSQPVMGTAFDLTPPAPVSGVSAALGADGVTVGWTAQPGYGYVVERARAGSSAFVELSAVLEGATFTDARGAAGDTYRVFAVTAGGKVGAPSEGVPAAE